MRMNIGLILNRNSCVSGTPPPGIFIGMLPPHLPQHKPTNAAAGR
jgi:hypothetical protein